MSYADFNDDYRNRTSGLSAWLQSLAAPSSTPQHAGPVSSPVDFGGLNPNDKAINLAQEAFQPGSAEIQQSKPVAPEQPFRDTVLGNFAASLIPGVAGNFQRQRGQDIGAYVKSHKDADPFDMIQGVMSIDPRNAQAYIPALLDAAAKEPEVKKKQALVDYAKSLGAPQTVAGAPDFGSPSHEFDTGMVPPPPAVDQGVPLSGAMGLPAPARKPVSDAVNFLMNAPGMPSELPDTALQMFNQAQPSDEPAGGWWKDGVHLESPSQSYPNQYVDDSGDKYPAQTYQESHGDPNAVSPKGATGLKQLMPATAANPGFGIAPAKDSSTAENMRVGNEYMDAMLKKYNGNVPLALSGYNWGPGATDKWISEGSDPAKLPPETANYIKKVGPAIEAQLAGKAAPAAAPVKTALSAYQNAELDAFKANPSESQMNHYLESLKPGAAGENTSEIKNYEFAKTHPDFTTSKTLNGQMSAFADNSPFAQARDSGVTGNQLIATVPDKSVQNIAKQLLRGDSPFFQTTSKTPAAQRAAMEVAQAADPSYSFTTAPARKKNNDYFQPSGEGGKIISSIKAIGGHIVTMQKLHGEMDNSGLQPWNYIANKAELARDTPEGAAVNAYDESVNNIAPEMAKVIAGKTDVPLAEVEAQRAPFSSSLGPNAFNKATSTAAEMVAKRAQVMLDNWRSVMNDDSKPPAAQLDADTVKAFKDLGVDLTNYFDTGASPSKSATPAADMASLQAAAAAELAKRKGG